METNQRSVIIKNYFNKVEEIILNNTPKLNAASLDMLTIIFDQIKNYVSDDINLNFLSYNKNFIDYKKAQERTTPKVLILTGEGNKSFCAGGDIIALYNQMLKKDFDKILEFYEYEILTDFCFLNMTPITVSIWNGYVMGGGLGLSVNSKFRIATDNTVFAMPETTIGLYPDVGAAYFLTRIFNNNKEIGLYCGLTGYKVEGRQCAISGAATHFVQKENLQQLKNEIINSFSNEKSENINEESLNNLIEKFSEIKYCPENFAFPNEDLIKKVFIFDSVENIFLRLEEIIKGGSSPHNKNWAQSTLDKLNLMSPLSLVIFFEFSFRALNFKNISEAYKLDLKLFQKIVEDENSDFSEGIRALLVDKDKNPKWRYRSIWDIKNKEEIIKQLFDD